MPNDPAVPVGTEDEPGAYEMAVDRALDAALAATGTVGLKAIAIFAQHLGASAALCGLSDDPDGWMPMDFVMQAAWEKGGTPDAE